MNVNSSSGARRKARVAHAGRKAASPSPRSAAGLPQDAAALDALAWMERGMPDGEIVYDEDTPRLSKEQLAEFKPARFVFSQRRK